MAQPLSDVGGRYVGVRNVGVRSGGGKRSEAARMVKSMGMATTYGGGLSRSWHSLHPMHVLCRVLHAGCS